MNLGCSKAVSSRVPRAKGERLRFAPLMETAVAALLAAGGALAQSTAADTRLEMSCPPSNSVFESAQPTKQYPNSAMPLEIEYSIGPDLVSLRGDETEVFANLGGGDDVAYLFETGNEAGLLGGAGADTILLCSMTDLSAMISLGGDADSDVLIIEPSVFTTVPTNMIRTISIMGIDPARDVVVIRAPADLLAAMDRSRQDAALRIGDVIFTTISISVHEGLNSSEAFRFVPVQQ